MKLPNLLSTEESTSSPSHTHPAMPTSFSADAISCIYNTVPKPFKLGGADGESTNQEPEFPPPPPELLEDSPTSAPGSFLKPPSAFIKKSRTPSPNSQGGINRPTPLREEEFLSEKLRNIGAENPIRTGEHVEADDDKNVKVGDFIRSLNSKANNQTTQTNSSRYGNMNTVDNQNIHNSTGLSNNVSEMQGNGLTNRFESKPYESTINSVKIESFNQLNEKITAPNKMVAKHLDNINRRSTSAGPTGDFNSNVSTNTANLGPNEDFRSVNASGDINMNNGVKVTNLDELMDDLNLNANSNHPDDTCQNFLTKTQSSKSCKQCQQAIHFGDVAIYTEKLGDAVLWHPQCFVCTTCNELLVDLMYFHYKSNVYCLRDYAHMLAIPRCHACDELIFVNEYTLAENKTFHVKHFCCYECDKELCNQSYIPVTESRDGESSSHPYCLDCYYKNFSKTCSACKKVINVQDKCIQFNNTHYWHIKTECFACAQCAKFLNNERFMMQFEKPFCSRQCVLDFSKTA